MTRSVKITKDAKTLEESLSVEFSQKSNAKKKNFKKHYTGKTEQTILGFIMSRLHVFLHPWRHTPKLLSCLTLGRCRKPRTKTVVLAEVASFPTSNVDQISGKINAAHKQIQYNRVVSKVYFLLCCVVCMLKSHGNASKELLFPFE